eukprot:jgi/Mesvir1/5169/Mv15307-RA.1
MASILQTAISFAGCQSRYTPARALSGQSLRSLSSHGVLLCKGTSRAPALPSPFKSSSLAFSPRSRRVSPSLTTNPPVQAASLAHPSATAQPSDHSQPAPQLAPSGWLPRFSSAAVTLGLLALASLILPSLLFPSHAHAHAGGACCAHKKAAADAAVATAAAASSTTCASAGTAATAAAHVGIGERIAATLRSAGWPDPVVLLALALLPIVELRGAVPVGHWMGLHPGTTYVISVLGNMLPVPFILAFLGPVSGWLSAHSALAAKFFKWLFTNTRDKAASIMTADVQALALMLFVAVPLPLTGAWSGAIAAHLLGMPFWESFVSVLVGVMVAGVIMTIVAKAGWVGAAVAGVAIMAVVGGVFLKSVQAISKKA